MDIGSSKYDDWGWHIEAAVDAGQPMEAGFVHIGLYLAWLIRHDLHEPAALPRDHVAAVKSGEMSGSDLADDIDGKLVSDVLTDEGAAFSDFYYPTYGDDFASVFASQAAYEVEDTPANYERIAVVLDAAFAAWTAAGRPSLAREEADPVAESSPEGRGPVLPASMERAEIDAYLDEVNRKIGLEAIRVDEIEGPHAAPELEQLLVDRLALKPAKVSSSTASQWGSSLLNRALKRLGVRPRDAMVVSTVIGSRGDTVMVALYAVPGITAASLVTEFASAIHRPSSRNWRPTEIAGLDVMVTSDRQFTVIYWAVDGLVFHLGASNTADLSDLVGRLADR